MNPTEPKDRVDLTTADGMMLYAKSFGEMCRQQFASCGQLFPVVTVIATYDPERKCSFGEPAVIHVAMPDMSVGSNHGEIVAQKRRAATFLRDLVLRTKAIGVVTGMEVWISSNEKFRNRDFSEDPDRREAISVLVEHARFTGTRQLRADITRDAAGNGIVGEFIEDTTVVLKGRFTDLLGRTRFA